MKELKRRAMLGDKWAQEECTEKGIVLPCAHGSECRIFRIEVDGKTAYRVISMHCCCFQGPARLTEKDALSDWNIRTAPPIGRCGECANRYSSEYCECRDDGDFCSDFAPDPKEVKCADCANKDDSKRCLLAEQQKPITCLCSGFELKGGEENA